MASMYRWKNAHAPECAVTRYRAELLTKPDPDGALTATVPEWDADGDQDVEACTCDLDVRGGPGRAWEVRWNVRHVADTLRMTLEPGDDGAGWIGRNIEGLYAGPLVTARTLPELIDAVWFGDEGAGALEGANDPDVLRVAYTVAAFAHGTD